mmetsp:Transcript_4265/g.10830  ORF Transcript_4265/g.10830 Transcript_4265/m.10830 type:complete len:292 (-) Transcript_4265:1179-2054(-)
MPGTCEPARSHSAPDDLPSPLDQRVSILGKVVRKGTLVRRRYHVSRYRHLKQVEAFLLLLISNAQLTVLEEIAGGEIPFHRAFHRFQIDRQNASAVQVAPTNGSQFVDARRARPVRWRQHQNGHLSRRQLAKPFRFPVLTTLEHGTMETGYVLLLVCIGKCPGIFLALTSEGPGAVAHNHVRFPVFWPLKLSRINTRSGHQIRFEPKSSNVRVSSTLSSTRRLSPTTARCSWWNRRQNLLRLDGNRCGRRGRPKVRRRIVCWRCFHCGLGLCQGCPCRLLQTVNLVTQPAQ